MTPCEAPAQSAVVVSLHAELEETKAQEPDVFADLDKLRKAEVELPNLIQDEREIEAAKFNDTVFGRIATDRRFEIATMLVISMNSIVIGYDADYTARFTRPDGLYDADQPMQFIVLELFFAIYFSAELLIRFLAFRRKCDCFWDRWFVFDGTLVFMMVVELVIVETVVISMTGSGSPMAGASVLRLLRLLRVTRMSRLMRSFPELMIIIKGLAASVGSVFWTGFILVLMTYTWAILFTSEYHQGRDSDEDILCCGDLDCSEEKGLVLFFDEDHNEPKTVHDCVVQAFFGSIGKSMSSLLVMGSVLDDVTACCDAIRRSSSPHFLGFFILYIILASFTMLNMLTGVLCQLVTTTAEEEKVKQSADKLRKAVRTIVAELDLNADGDISLSEFAKLQKDKRVMASLKDFDIGSNEIEQYSEFFFPQRPDGRESTVSVNEMTEAMLRTRPGCTVSSLEVASMRHSLVRSYTEVQTVVSRIAETIFPSVALSLDDADEGLQVDNAFDGTNSRPGSENPEDSQDITSFCADKVEEMQQVCSVDLVSEIQKRTSSGGGLAPKRPLSSQEVALLRALAAREGMTLEDVYHVS